MRALAAAALAVAGAIALAAQAAPVHYKVPPETAAPEPGPNMQLVRANCTICHSFDYVITQPRSFADPTAFWTAEVNKMRTVYGAPLDPANVKPIVDYLAAVYGK
ncbi:MAG TPA: cytochrome c [Acidisphaera sp.]|nr:cytochrome c [Acidisphaera sp.]